MNAFKTRISAQTLAAFFVAVALYPLSQQAVAAQSAYASGPAVAKDAPAAAVARSRMDLREMPSGDTLHIVVGRSTIVRVATPMRRIYIGNPAVLQSYTSGPSEIVLTAKTPGLSSLVIWDTLGQSCLYTVSADVDSAALQQSLQQAYPTSKINVEGHEGRIYLTGTVPTQDVADSAAKLAIPYAKDVVSSLRVVTVHGKQVQLKLRIVEVDRTRMEQYGINFAGGGSTPFAVSTQQYNAPTPVAGIVQYSDPLNLLVFNSALNVAASVKDLEQKQILQVLAEPTLTAMSGQSAKFLSGGEFPFPVVEGSGTAGVAPTISIMFKPYGIKMDFTPTVNADGTILLKVAPEVSALDYSNAVTISGFTIPALSTRRAETQVDIQSGQTFALSGLLDHRTTEMLNQLPGISSIPILGKLFTSKSYLRSVVELVVLVTATVVDPLNPLPLPPEPKFAVPNLDNNSYDKSLSKEQKLPPARP